MVNCLLIGTSFVDIGHEGAEVKKTDNCSYLATVLPLYVCSPTKCCLTPCFRYGGPGTRQVSDA